ncbi:spore germination protein GerPE [Paenibacillus sp. GCM10023248]|uniref:spore germination protein GerPE n=1 Tax=Bacillales TaxID=1385 RepID=UPI002377E722|nr:MULTISPECIES: spore germination protein GerPE [Bacillales]MDD9271046.1 spore germination protein GerPE [Paenibacillus sp. MAHUQ-63]MDR6882816.1 spore germination protein PE [Bacillus sp. 3255]
MARLSIVGYVYVNSISISSVMQVGDNVNTALNTNVFAVQREVPIYYGNEGSFKAYPFYRRPIPIPQPPEPFTMCVDNLGSFIRVRGLRILGLSATSVLQIGSNRISSGESRVMNIRQFVTNKPGPKEQTTFINLGKADVIGDLLPAIKPPLGL